MAVWALYPETSQRTLEEIDILFASKSPFVWDAESHFAAHVATNPEFGAVRVHNAAADDPEKTWKAEHEETMS